MMEPRILALADRLEGSGGAPPRTARLAGLFALLGRDFQESAMILRRATEVYDRIDPSAEMAAMALEGKWSLGLVLREMLDA